MEAENLHGRLSVGVIGWLEAQVLQTHLAEEVLEEAHEATERQTKVGDNALDLVELGQMGSVDSLVTEDTVDGEVARRSRVLSETVEYPSGYGGGMCSEHEAQTFVCGPRVPVSHGAESALLVHLLYVLPVLLKVARLGLLVGCVGLREEFP